MELNILGDVEKIIAEKNKKISKDEEIEQIKLSDFQRGKIRDLERSIDSFAGEYKNFSRLLGEVENQLDSIGVDFGSIRKKIDSEIDNIIK